MNRNNTSQLHAIVGDPYENLGNAVILVACEDYRRTLRGHRVEQGKTAGTSKKELEKFFHSGYFGVLTSIDPDMLIRKLQEEVGRHE